MTYRRNQEHSCCPCWNQTNVSRARILRNSHYTKGHCEQHKINCRGDTTRTCNALRTWSQTRGGTHYSLRPVKNQPSAIVLFQVVPTSINLTSFPIQQTLERPATRWAISRRLDKFLSRGTDSNNHLPFVLELKILPSLE